MLLEKGAGGRMAVSDWGRRALRAVLSLLQWPDHHRRQGRCPGPSVFWAPTVILIRLPRAAACPWAGVPGWPSSPLAALAVFCPDGSGAPGAPAPLVLPSPPARPGRARPCRASADRSLLQRCCRGMLGRAPPPLPPAALSHAISGLGGQGCWSDHGHCPVCLLGSRAVCRASFPSP